MKFQPKKKYLMRIDDILKLTFQANDINVFKHKSIKRLNKIDAKSIFQRKNKS